jgi:hypothetical protein
MSSLAEFVAATLLWLSAMALCQFGLATERQIKAPPKAERIIARTPRQQAVQGREPCPLRHGEAISA